MLQPLVALDLGSTKIACAVGQPHESSSGFEILGTSLVPYPTLSEAWLSDPLLVGRTIEQALEATAVHGDFHRAVVAMNHPALVSEHVRVSVVLGDEPITVRSQDLDRLRTTALDAVLGVDREPLVAERLGCSGNGFDGVRDPRGLLASRLFGAFHIVTMPVAARRAVVQAVESAGLEVARLVHTFPAAYAAIAESSPHARMVMIDVGGLTTDIGYIAEGILQAFSTVAYGGTVLATEIAKRLGVTMEQATTWSLEGTSCRNAAVREIIKEQYAPLEPQVDMLLKGRPRPDRVLVTGRGALSDGFAEWCEHLLGMPLQLCRSPRTQQLGDLSRQVALTVPIGLLELTTQRSEVVATRPTDFFNRLVHTTRTILTEYF